MRVMAMMFSGESHAPVRLRKAPLRHPEGPILKAAAIFHAGAAIDDSSTLHRARASQCTWPALALDGRAKASDQLPRDGEQPAKSCKSLHMAARRELADAVPWLGARQ